MKRACARLCAALALGAAALVGTAAPAAGAANPFIVETVARLQFPTGLQFSTSGRLLFVNERAGRIRILRDGVLQAEPFAIVPTTTEGEGGLLGLALDPDFERGSPWVYVFRTLSDGSADQVERYRSDGSRAAGHETIMRNLPAGGYHHGGILAFGPDGKLYVSNGEGHVGSRAQNPRALGGKIYRVNRDGSVPSDNPFPGSPTWAYGIRNPFGMAFDTATGTLWESENGPQDHDEVNHIRRGANYGWPVVRGKAGDPRFVDPAVDYERIIVPTGIAFAGDAFPQPYRGNLFLGAYGQESIHRLVLSADRLTVARDEIFLKPGEGVVGMAWGPDGLYFTTPTRLARVRARAGAIPTPEKTPTPSPATTASPVTPRAGRSIGLWVALMAAGITALIVAVSIRRRR